MDTRNHHLRKLRRLWYFQVSVPADLAPYVGRKLISQSLRTDDVHKARGLRDALLVEYQGMFERLRKKHNLIDRNDVLATARRIRAELEAGTKTPTEAADEWTHVDMAVFQEWGPDETWDDEERKTFATASRIASGERVTTLSEAIAEYLRTVERRVTPQTLAAKAKRLEALQASIGDIPLETFDRKVASRYVTSVLLPMEVSQKTKLDTLGDLKAAAEAWSRMGYLPANPFDRLRSFLAESSRGTTDDDARRPWTDAELGRLLEHLRSMGTDDPLWKVTILGAYTGCRISELCEARWVDVRDDCLDVREAKTKAGLRLVPLHPLLLPWVEQWRELGGEFLIPGLTPGGQNNKRSFGISKRFGRVKTKLGFGGELVYHALRHSFITKLEQAHVPESTIGRLVGHSQQGFSLRQYSGGLELEQLRDAVAKVSYGPTDALMHL